MSNTTQKNTEQPVAQDGLDWNCYWQGGVLGFIESEACLHARSYSSIRIRH